MTQRVALYLTVVLVALIAWMFGRVMAGASTKVEGPATVTPYRWRGPLFWGLTVAGLIITFATLWQWPITAYASGASPQVHVVQVTGRQWTWQVTPDTVSVGELVEFQATGADVNHGFAIYRDHTAIVGQTQAMPGYVNRLRLTFSTPGSYDVMCLEYCGLGHHAMRSSLVVVPRAAGAGQ